MTIKAPVAKFIYGDVTINLGTEAVVSVIRDLDYQQLYGDLMVELAKSPCSRIREAMAGRDKLPDECVTLLAGDSEQEVLRNLLGSEAAQQNLTHDQIMKLVNTSATLAMEIAGNMESFTQADSKALAAVLVGHPDPEVRKAFAGNWQAPKKLRQGLLKDPDPDVVAAAQSSLD